MWPSGAGDSTANAQTAADFDTSQDRIAGSVNVSLLATEPGRQTRKLHVDGVPVRNATVSHDGDIVGRTDPPASLN